MPNSLKGKSGLATILIIFHWMTLVRPCLTRICHSIMTPRFINGYRHFIRYGMVLWNQRYMRIVVSKMFEQILVMGTL